MSDTPQTAPAESMVDRILDLMQARGLMADEADARAIIKVMREPTRPILAHVGTNSKTTINDLIDKISDPDNIVYGNRWQLNDAIATILWGEPKISGGRGSPKRMHWWDGGMGREVAPDFLGSLDAAIMVYPTLPDTIPSHPRVVCIDALKRIANGES